MYYILIINFLLAISTTIGMAVIPFLVTDSLGLSLFILGLLEGFTEFLSNIFRLINGILFDRIENKRLVFVSSTGIAFIAKALLFLPTPWAILFSKTLERVSNGTFASPRDAYVAKNAKNKGLALGLLSVSKTAGCVLGPLVVSVSTLFLGSLKDNLIFFVWVCCGLAFLSFSLSFSLKIDHIEKQYFHFAQMKSIFKRIMPVLILTFIFFLGRFNDGLLMMRLKHTGFPEWFYLSIISIFNATMLICSPIIGRQIDLGNTKAVLYATILSLITFNICFYQISEVTWFLSLTGIICWGVQRAGAQVVLASMIFKSVPKENYGTAIGLFYVISGLATMLASFLCGYLATNDMFNTVFSYSGTCGLFAMITAGIILHRQTEVATPLPANS